MAYIGRSDVNMSSEGSVSSRLRQFGLYKTIDSRTEEFLKLSRKRQIRRGCACAVVSTAITVTVVVSALMIYQYGFRKNAKMTPSTLHRTNWFKAVNNTDVSDKKKDTKNNKSKLLPIIFNALDPKASYSKSCRCRNNSSIETTLKQLYKTIQQIRSKNIEKNLKAVEIRKNSSTTEVPPRSSYKKLKHASIPSTRRKIVFPRTSQKPLTFKAETTSLKSAAVSKIKMKHTDKKDNSKSEVNESPTNQNKFTESANINKAINKGEIMSQKFVFKINDYKITTTDTSIKPTVRAYTENSKLVNINTTTKMPVIDVIEKDSQNKQIFEFDYNDYEEENYDNGIDHILPNSSQYFNAHVDKEKSEILEKYNWPNYMDSLSKIYAKAFPISKPKQTHSSGSPTMKPFDLFSFDKVDPLENPMKTSTKSPHTSKPIELFKAHQMTEVKNSTKQQVAEQIKFPPSKPAVRSKKMSTSLTMQTIEKPTDTSTSTSLLEAINSDGKNIHEYALFPVIRSVLLRKEREVYSVPNSNTKTGTGATESLTTEPEKFIIRVLSK